MFSKRLSYLYIISQTITKLARFILLLKFRPPTLPKARSSFTNKNIMEVICIRCVSARRFLDSIFLYLRLPELRLSAIGPVLGRPASFQILLDLIALSLRQLNSCDHQNL